MVIEPGQDMRPYSGVVGDDGNGGNNNLPPQDGVGILSQPGGGNLHPMNTDSSHVGLNQTRFPTAAQNPMFIPSSRKLLNYNYQKQYTNISKP